MRKAIGVLGLAGALASPTFAADDFSGFRLGVNISSDTLESDLFFDPTLTTASMNNNRFGYGLFGGWALNRYFAVETGLRSGGEFNDDPLDASAATLNLDTISSHTDVKGIDASAVGSLWIGRKFSLFGRVGVFGWKAEQTMALTRNPTDLDPVGVRQVVSVDDTGFELLYGAGIQTELDGALMRIEYQFTSIGDLGTAGAFNLHDNEMQSLMFSVVWVIR